MIEGYNPVLQAFIGTLFTWGLTAAGAAVVFFVHGSKNFLDGSLGFAAGVMTAASFWSLLEPAVQMAEESKLYGKFSCLPVGFGFLLGALFVYGVDILITKLGVHSPNMMLALHTSKNRREKQGNESGNIHEYESETTAIDVFNEYGNNIHLRTRGKPRMLPKDVNSEVFEETSNIEEIQHGKWKRMLLLIVAITAHNIPEGLAVGVGFGGIGGAATFNSARNLAIGIGIQNFPEGLAVSLPLNAAGYPRWKSFWWGQLSGMVEPIFGVLGAFAVSIARPILPYALAFAAGAMIYVVVDDIIPEANSSGNGKIASWSTIAGFLVMMVMDVGLG